MVDFVKINKKYDNYIAYKNDLLISTAGTCGRVIKLSFEQGYHAHHMPRFINIKINKDYLYYFILTTFDKSFINANAHGSVVGHLKMETILKSSIKLLSPSQMKKLKLQALFDEVDTLKETLEQTKQEYKELTEELFKDFKKPDTTSEKLQSQDEKISTEQESEIESEPEIIQEVKPKKLTKNIVVEPDVKTKVVKQKSDTSKKDKKKTKQVTIDV